jgi:hypothetical protein
MVVLWDECAGCAPSSCLSRRRSRVAGSGERQERGGCCVGQGVDAGGVGVEGRCKANMAGLAAVAVSPVAAILKALASRRSNGVTVLATNGCVPWQLQGLASCCAHDPTAVFGAGRLIINCIHCANAHLLVVPPPRAHQAHTRAQTQLLRRGSCCCCVCCWRCCWRCWRTLHTHLTTTLAHVLPEQQAAPRCWSHATDSLADARAQTGQ